MNTMPREKLVLMHEIAAVLQRIEGVVAVALGGSHARGVHHEGSDLDTGIYYREAAPFAIEDIRKVARSISTAGEAVVTGFYEWGPWVNGGAWIKAGPCKVDFLYRNLEQIGRTVDEAKAGIWHHHFDQQPPFGFRSVVLLAELDCCIPLHDPDGAIAVLKKEIAVYPASLKRQIVGSMLGGADFSLIFARDFATKGDVINTVGCMTRIVHYLIQALFAVNEVWFISDKTSAGQVEKFERRPEKFREVLDGLLGCPGANPEQLTNSVELLTDLFQQTADLAGFHPHYVHRAK